MRLRLTRISPLGIPPATEPVLPLWGTIAAPAAAQARTTAATSSVQFGITISGVAPTR
jgi:hypothetical protein